MTTNGEKLFNDPRIEQAKDLIYEAIKDHQSNLTGVKAPDPAKKVQYQDLMDEFGTVRGGKLMLPYLGSGIGNGALVELLDGSVKYDFITGIGVHLQGHSNIELIDQGINGVLENTIHQGNLQQNKSTKDLMDALIRNATKNGANLNHVFLTTSGAMAVENSLKIAFQHKTPANRILAFDNCFHGRTLAACQVTDKPQYRVGMPDTLQVDHIAFNSKHTVKKLEKHIKRHHGKHAAMMVELVQGEGGFNVGQKDILVDVCKLLRDNDIIIIFDEVQTFGRTYEMFAYQWYGLDEYADIVNIGKAAQVCATLYNKELTPVLPIN
jgi:acetylornithine aminotransferase